MRNNLLVAMALCSATSSTLPLWASENWPDPALTFVEPNLTPDETVVCIMSITWLPKSSCATAIGKTTGELNLS